MELISPITAEGCSPYIGKPVCAVLQDGTHVYGYLHRVDGEKVYFTSAAEGPGTVSSASAPKAKKQLKEKQDKAQTKFFGPFFPGLFALDLALIAFLFAVPFFFWW